MTEEQKAQLEQYIRSKSEQDPAFLEWIKNNPEEFARQFLASGRELSDDELDGVAGGGAFFDSLNNVAQVATVVSLIGPISSKLL